MKLLFTAPIKRTTFEKIKPEIIKLGYDVDFYDEKILDKKIYANDYDVLLCYDPFRYLEFSENSCLKAIITSSTGVNQIPSFLLEKRDIQIANNHGGYAIPIAEWVVMSILLGLKNYPAIEQKKKEKIWKIERDTLEAEGKKVLFLGAGRIAVESANRLRAFNFELTAYRKSDKQDPSFDKIITFDTLDDAIKTSDVIVVCLPDTQETKNFVDKDKIEMMKDDAIFINVARGTIVDEKSLLNAIDGGKFRFLALDVFEKEPLSKDSPFWNIDRLFLSTHTSWYSQNREKRVYEHFMRNLKSYAESGKLYNQINKRLKY